MKISKFAVFLLSIMIGCGILTFGSAEAVTIDPYSSFASWDTAVGTYDTEDFNGIRKMDEFVGAYDTGYLDTGQVILQELGTDKTASFAGAGGNYLDVISYANRPTNADGAAVTPYAVNGSDFVRVAIANNYSNSGLGLSDADIRFRIIFEDPVNYFAFSYNSRIDFEIALGVKDVPTEIEGYQNHPNPLADKAFATLGVGADSTSTTSSDGFFGLYSDQAFSSVYFQTAGYDPEGSRAAGGIGIDDVRWASVKVPEPATMLLLGLGLLGLAGISRRRLRK